MRRNAHLAHAEWAFFIPCRYDLISTGAHHGETATLGKSPNQQWDYIIIGSGMGGMTTAAMLSHFGKKVLVLEQHYVPGGFTHTFEEKDTSGMLVFTPLERSRYTPSSRILHSLTNGGLEWASLGETYEKCTIQMTFPSPSQSTQRPKKTSSMPSSRNKLSHLL